MYPIVVVQGTSTPSSGIAGTELVDHEPLRADGAEIVLDLLAEPLHLVGGLGAGSRLTPHSAFEQELEERRGVADDGDRVREVTPDLCLVDVEVDDGLLRRELVAEEVGADGQDHVGVVEQRLHPAVDPDRAPRRAGGGRRSRPCPRAS